MAFGRRCPDSVGDCCCGEKQHQFVSETSPGIRRACPTCSTRVVKTNLSFPLWKRTLSPSSPIPSVWSRPEVKCLETLVFILTVCVISFFCRISLSLLLSFSHLPLKHTEIAKLISLSWRSGFWGAVSK